LNGPAPATFHASRSPQTKYQVNSSDDAVKIAIADHDAHVVVFFGKRISWFEMPKSQMIEFAKALLARAGVRVTIHDDAGLLK
jgi:hypothetical protein